MNCRQFTSRTSPGHIYKTHLTALLNELEWKHENVDPEIVDMLTLSLSNSRRMNLFVPAFIQLIEYLNTTGQDFVFVIRTFGSDIPRMFSALSLIAKGLHPGIPIPGCISEPSACGELRRCGDSFNLEFGDPERIISGIPKILEYIESLPSKSVILINDDYDTWKRHGYRPEFGKPVFFNPARIDSIRHFLFDDNINMDPNDSIACVWLPDSDSSFKAYPHSDQIGLTMIGTVLLQVSLYNSILDNKAFVSELTNANKRYNTLIQRIQRYSK